MKLHKSMTIALSATCFIGVGWYLYADRQIRTVSYDASQVSYRTSNELEASAKLLISGVPLKQENHVTYDKDGFIQESFTVTSLQIQKVFANPSGLDLKKSDIIQVAEPIYVLDNGIKPGKTEFSINGYKKMKMNSSYFLVLKPDITYPNLFVISGTNQGKYNIDNSDLHEKDHVNDKEKNDKFKEDFVRKYKIQ